jgi:hypothetical protein
MRDDTEMNAHADTVEADRAIKIKTMGGIISQFGEVIRSLALI